MQRRVVVLGTGPIAIDPAVPREGSHSVDDLLSTGPETAVVAAEGREAFFRASAALERDVRRVILRRGSLSRVWLDELAARATELGGELYLRGDEDRFERVRSHERYEVGAPPEGAFAFTKLEPAAGGAPMVPLEVPSGERALRCEEVAFAIGLKPVLYLVVDRGRVGEVLEQHRGQTIVQERDRLEADQHSGERTYGVGDEVVHMFIGDDARRAAELWGNGGSSRHVDELGSLMGYPRCCVRAFHAMANRRINAAFPYVTAARTRALGARFDILLDVTYARLIPFVPCTYGCRAAIDWAGAVARAAAITRRPRVTLYFDEARAVTFEHASVEGDEIAYRAPRWAAPALDDRSAVLRHIYGEAFGDEGRVRLEDRAIVIERGGATTTLDRASGLGVILPFE